MRQPLLLVSGGGLAREVLALVRLADAYDVVGFVDDDPVLRGQVIDDVKVLGGLEVVADMPGTDVLLCAGRGAVRAAMNARLRLPDERYATVTHPDVRIPSSCAVGAGSVLSAGCVLTADVSVGRHVVAMPRVVLTHDDVVADFATLCAGVVLGGSVEVAERAYVGMNASVRERVRIGAGAVVGMGSVVLTDIPDGRTWWGVPARNHGGSQQLAPTRIEEAP